MNLRTVHVVWVTVLLAICADVSTAAQPNVRVTGVVRDEINGITLPGVPVEVVEVGQAVHTDVDGRYILDLAPGTYELRVRLEGYQTRTLTLVVAANARRLTADVGLRMETFSETVTVVADAPLDAVTSSRELQLVERRQAQVISDNLGGEEMKANGDGDAASAMSRVTGLSVVDNQYIFVRGLGERYSNTTLAGSVLPTTEPDKKVVPLDLFPTGLLDSIQVNKSYSPDRSAEFAGGLVQIVPLKLPQRPVVDFAYGVSHLSNATGKSIPLSPLGTRDWLGYDRGARALPASFPTDKIVRRGIFTPETGYSAEEITAFGRALDRSAWTPAIKRGAPGQNWGAVFGNRFGRLGVVASVTHSYKEQYVEEERSFFVVASDDELSPFSEYRIQTGTEKAQMGVVANLAYQFTPNHRLSLENFYSHTGRDEGRYFEGPNYDNGFDYRNYRLQFIEEGLLSNALGGEHFFRTLGNSRVDWRMTVARASRDEPDLREVMYESPLTSTAATRTYVLTDRTQSGFRMFNDLDDRTVDVAVNWSLYRTAKGRATQIKFGASHVDRGRDFSSRRFRYVPIVLGSGGAALVDLRLPPEALYATENIGTAFRFNEDTRPTDAYEGQQTTTAGYGMMDLSLTSRTRLVTGARVERFEQTVDTFDPFGLFERRISAENRKTEVFPSLNLVQALSATTNLRVSYSGTVNRPEFRELAPFEFTDVVGNRAVRGNPDLTRAFVQNVDGRVEKFMGSRGILAGSVFYKHFNDPIERIVLAAVQPIVTFQNADTARNFGLEAEAGHQFGPVFVNANYTYVDSHITLSEAQRAVQTSLRRPLAGQSTNLFNLITEYATAGFTARLLVNYYGDRISDVGSNEAPDIIEQGRPSLNLVVAQSLGRFNVRFGIDNLVDSEYRFTQGAEDQRVFSLGRTVSLSLGLNVF